MRSLALWLLPVALSCATAFGGPVTWTLNNAVFDDGGIATGNFVFDAATDSVNSYQISVSGGNTDLFPAFLYQDGSAHNISATSAHQSGWNFLFFNTDLLFPDQFANPRQLRLPFDSLPESDGTVAFNLANPFQGECYDCNPWRPFVSGEAPAAGGNSVPEPATFLVGVPLLWLLIRKRLHA
jgi:hypothetical protein